MIITQSSMSTKAKKSLSKKKMYLEYNLLAKIMETEGLKILCKVKI
jgi:hypothetical protein